MNVPTKLAQVASSISDPSRAGILSVLLDGRYHTASELSVMIGVTPQTTSYHLNKLLEQELILVDAQGRHRYFGIRDSEVANAIETLLTISPAQEINSLRKSNEDKAIRFARTCYDHIAGNVGVKITDALLEKGILLYSENNFTLTEAGEHFFNHLEVDIKTLRRKRRSFCHKCLDWSERRHHLAGSLGSALLDKFIELGWIKRMDKTRAISITDKGKEGLKELLFIEI